MQANSALTSAHPLPFSVSGFTPHSGPENPRVPSSAPTWTTSGPHGGACQALPCGLNTEAKSAAPWEREAFSAGTGSCRPLPLPPPRLVCPDSRPYLGGPSGSYLPRTEPAPHPGSPGRSERAEQSSPLRCRSSVPSPPPRRLPLFLDCLPGSLPHGSAASLHLLSGLATTLRGAEHPGLQSFRASLGPRPAANSRSPSHHSRLRPRTKFLEFLEPPCSVMAAGGWGT